MQKIQRKVKPFWPLVMHRKVIDLSGFDKLPVGKRSITFEFIDPVWAWVHAAWKQPASTMHWVPRKQYLIGKPEQLHYGGGLQFGEAFAEAYRTCPIGTHPMLISLHWDGSNAHGLATTPICIGVANTNSTSANTQFCIGYMPVVSDVGDKFKGSTDATEVKFYIRNQAIAAILAVLETAARSGVRCRLPSRKYGVEEEMILMPKLFCLNLDQPEAQLYFGMRHRWYLKIHPRGRV